MSVSANGKKLHIREANPLDKDRWNSFLETCGDVHHSLLFEWSTIISTSFRQRPRYLIAEDESNAIAGVLPLIEFRSKIFGDAVISLPFLNAGGALVKHPETAAALFDHAITLHNSLKTDFIEIRERNEVGSLDSKRFNSSTHKVSMELELIESEALFASFSKKLRSQIRRPQKSNYRAEFSAAGSDNSKFVCDFYRVFSENMRDLGTPVYSKAFIESILREHPERATIVIVYGPKGPAACGMMIGFGRRVEMLLASSKREFNADAPNMLLYWEAMQWAVQRGYSCFDFGRSSPDSGPYRFKEQWGAKPRQLHWYYHPLTKHSSEVSPSSGKFGLAVRCWQLLPLQLANLIGPLLSRMIP